MRLTVQERYARDCDHGLANCPRHLFRAELRCPDLNALRDKLEMKVDSKNGMFFGNYVQPVEDEQAEDRRARRLLYHVATIRFHLQLPLRPGRSHILVSATRGSRRLKMSLIGRFEHLPNRPRSDEAR